MTRHKSNLSKKAISVITGIAFLLLGYFFIHRSRVNSEENLKVINRNTLQMLSSEKDNLSLNANNNLVQVRSEIDVKNENANQLSLSKEEGKFSEFISECLISKINKRSKELEYVSSLQDYLPRFNQIMQGLEVTQIDFKSDKVNFKFSDQNIEYDQFAKSLEILCHLQLLEGSIQCPVLNLDRAEQLARTLVIQDSSNSYPYVLLSLVYDKLKDQHRSYELLHEAHNKTDHFDIYFESNSQKLIQIYEKIDDYIYVSQVTSTLPMPKLFEIAEYLKSKNSFYVFDQMLKKNLDTARFYDGLDMSLLEYSVVRKFLGSQKAPLNIKEFVHVKDIL